MANRESEILSLTRSDFGRRVGERERESPRKRPILRMHANMRCRPFTHDWQLGNLAIHMSILQRILVARITLQSRSPFVWFRTFCKPVIMRGRTIEKITSIFSVGRTSGASQMQRLQRPLATVFDPSIYWQGLGKHLADNAPSVGIVRCFKNPVDAREKTSNRG